MFTNNKRDTISPPPEARSTKRVRMGDEMRSLTRTFSNASLEDDDIESRRPQAPAQLFSITTGNAENEREEEDLPNLEVTDEDYEMAEASPPPTSGPTSFSAPASLPPVSLPVPVSLPAPVSLPTPASLPAPASLPSASLPSPSLPPASPASLPPASLPPASLPSTSLPSASLPSPSLPPASLPAPASLPSASLPSASLLPASLLPVSLPAPASSLVVSSSSAPASIAKKQRKPRSQIGEYAKLKGGEIDVGMFHLVAKGYTKKNAASAATVKQSTLQTYDMRYRTNGNEKVTKKKRGPQPQRMITPEIKRAICEYLDLHSIVTVHQVRGMIAQRFQKTIAFHTMQEYLRKEFKLGLRGVRTWPELLEDDEDDVDGETAEGQQQCLLLGMDLMGAHGTKCVFVGEAGFDVIHRRRFPPGKEDELVPVRDRTEPVPRMKIILAINSRKLIHLKESYRPGKTTDEDVLRFLRDLIAQMDKVETYLGWHIVFNSVSPDMEKAIWQALKGHPYTPIFLPRCSFLHNPVFSFLNEVVVTMPRRELNPREKGASGKKGNDASRTSEVSSISNIGDKTLHDHMKATMLEVPQFLMQTWARTAFSVSCNVSE